jgi:hypothetical protein
MDENGLPEKRIEDTSDPSCAGRGRKVEMILFYETGETEPITVEIVPDKVSDFKNGLLGETTLLAKAISGHRSGETITYLAGDIVKVKIQDVLPGSHASHKEVLERRNAILTEAVRQSDLTNAIIFASAVNNKWGDYDPGAMTKELENKP